MIGSFRKWISTFSTSKLSLPKGVSTKFDAYKGLHIKVQDPLDKIEFNLFISNLMQNPQKGTSAIWVHLSAGNLEHIPYLIANHKFKIHQGKDDKISVYRWLREGAQDLVVPYSMFYVACGGVIIKDQKIFLIEEKKGDRKGEFGLPGGRANFSEDIARCSARQVLEQTGIVSNFQSILTIRELSNYTYGSFDLYFACLMKLNEKSFDNLKMCNEEVQSYKWVPLSELKQFISTRAIGTQLHINNYIATLYEQGFDFQKASQDPTPTCKAMDYISKRDQISRCFVQHWLVNPSLSLTKDKK